MTTTRQEQTGRKVHFLGTIFASRAACGQMIQAHRDEEDTQPLHSASHADVTCIACRRVLGI